MGHRTIKSPRWPCTPAAPSKRLRARASTAPHGRVHLLCQPGGRKHPHKQQQGQAFRALRGVQAAPPEYGFIMAVSRLGRCIMAKLIAAWVVSCYPRLPTCSSSATKAR